MDRKDSPPNSVTPEQRATESFVQARHDDPFLPPVIGHEPLNGHVRPGTGVFILGSKSCAICRRPTTVHQEVSGGICSRRYCRQQHIIQQAREQRERREKLEFNLATAHIEAMRTAHPGSFPEDVTLVVVPANMHQLTALPDSRKDAIENHIRAMTDKALEQMQDPQPVRTDIIDPMSTYTVHPDVHDTLLAGCATCKGQCCNGGGECAFITAATVRNFLKNHSEIEPDNVAAHYLEYLPTDSYEDSCVFHAAGGCTLPREIRSDTCNNFLCGPLRNLQDQIKGKRKKTVFAVSISVEEIESYALIESGSIRNLD